MIHYKIVECFAFELVKKSLNVKEELRTIKKQKVFATIKDFNNLLLLVQSIITTNHFISIQ